MSNLMLDLSLEIQNIDYIQMWSLHESCGLDLDGVIFSMSRTKQMSGSFPCPLPNVLLNFLSVFKLRGWLFLTKSHPLANLLDSLGSTIYQNLWVIGWWSLEVDAMATIGTIDVAVLHAVFLLSFWKLFHASILPGVFSGVEEINVFFHEVGSMVHSINLFPTWTWHIWAKDSLAVVRPVGKVQSLGSHGVVSMGNLEPSELRAVLVSPLSEIWVKVNSRLCQIFSIVLACRHSFFEAVGIELSPGVGLEVFWG